MTPKQLKARILKIQREYRDRLICSTVYTAYRRAAAQEIVKQPKEVQGYLFSLLNRRIEREERYSFEYAFKR